MNNAKQRFTEGMKKMTGVGTQYKKPGYTYPTWKQMDWFDQYDIAYDVDEPLRELVIELNREGYKTGGSCSGGHKNKHFNYDYGFITFHPSRTEMQDLINKYPDNQMQILTYFRLHGHSYNTIDPKPIKMIMRSYIGDIMIRHTQPTVKKLALFHSFRFPKISNKEV
jgi:hypothetical protein